MQRIFLFSLLPYQEIAGVSDHSYQLCVSLYLWWFECILITYTLYNNDIMVYLIQKLDGLIICWIQLLPIFLWIIVGMTYVCLQSACVSVKIHDFWRVFSFIVRMLWEIFENNFCNDDKIYIFMETRHDTLYGIVKHIVQSKYNA